MKIAITILIVFALGVSTQTLQGESGSSSEWGPADERGAANRITPGKVLEATRLIKEGRIYELGREYEAGMPLFLGRHYSLTIPGSPTGGPFGRNSVVYHDEMISGQIGQVGTQFDGLGHVGTRGVLIDMAGYKGVERLPVGTVFTVSDLQGALEKQATELSEGDVVFIHTGHGRLWMVDNDEYNRGAPGIGMEAALWLADKKVVLTGADTSSVEVQPSEDPELAFPVHQELIARRGIYILENLDLSELAADKVYEFAFMFAPVKFKGATGSPGNPIVIK